MSPEVQEVPALVSLAGGSLCPGLSWAVLLVAVSADVAAHPALLPGQQPQLWLPVFPGTLLSLSSQKQFPGIPGGVPPKAEHTPSLTYPLLLPSEPPAQLQLAGPV